MSASTKEREGMGWGPASVSINQSFRKFCCIREGKAAKEGNTGTSLGHFIDFKTAALTYPLSLGELFLLGVGLDPGVELVLG